MEIKKHVSVEHQNVPEAHRGLHDFLYQSDDEHAANRVNATSGLQSSGMEVLPLETWRSHPANTKVAGVYAVLDTAGRTQYVGYSRNILLALNAHMALNGPETCAFIRVQTFKYPKRDAMEALRDAWLSALDRLPPGNGEASQQWAGTVGEAVQAAMLTEERNAYEEKKLKLRKAMADTTLVNESQMRDTGPSQRTADGRLENDDWSSTIDEQNQQTSS
jgi:hypothetical protein